jgi:hypothetical protein
LGGGQRTFGGRSPWTDGDRDGGSFRQGFFGFESQPTPVLSIFDQVFHLGICLDFILRGEAQADRLAAGIYLDRFKDCGWIDALVKGNKKEGVDGLRCIVRIGINIRRKRAKSVASSHFTMTTD